MSILVVAEHDNNEIKGSTLNTVAAASEIGGDISILVAGSESLSVAEQAEKISGITSIIQPGGSKRDQESIDTCDNSKISMVFTGTRHFRH